MPEGEVLSVGPRPRRPVATAIVAVLVAMVAALVIVRLVDSEEPSAVSDGATLNTSSWTEEEGQLMMRAGIRGVVQVDANGCVHLVNPRSGAVTNLVWPAGYTASRRADGSIVISDSDGVVVAETGHHLRVSGGEVQSRIDWSCSAEDALGAFMITDFLPPLNG